MTSPVRIEVEHPLDPAGDVMVVNEWLSYEIESDMFTAADAFTLRVAPTREYTDYFRRPGHACRIYYLNNLIMTGFIEACPTNVGTHGPQLELTGRDLGALLVDDAAPMLDLSNQTLRSILEKLIQDHPEIQGIITDNNANRYGLVGKRANYSKSQAIKKDKKWRDSYKTAAARDAAARKAAVEAEAKARRQTSIKLYPPYTTEKAFKRQTKPGETRWNVIKRLTRAAGLAAWMTADGYLCVARPDYQQDPIGRLFVHVDLEGNTTDSNCLMTLSPDIGNRHSEYTFLAQGRAHATTAGKDLSALGVTVRDPSWAFWWDEASSRRRKAQVKAVQNIGNKKQLIRYARTMMERKAVGAYNCTATFKGHETTPGGPLWAVDTVVDVDFQPKRIMAPHLVRMRQLAYDAAAGDSTNMGLIPPIWLAFDHDTLSDAAYWAKMRPLFERYAL